MHWMDAWAFKRRALSEAKVHRKIHILTFEGKSHFKKGGHFLRKNWNYDLLNAGLLEIPSLYTLTGPQGALISSNKRPKPTWTIKESPTKLDSLEIYHRKTLSYVTRRKMTQTTLLCKNLFTTVEKRIPSRLANCGKVEALVSVLLSTTG